MKTGYFAGFALLAVTATASHAADITDTPRKDGSALIFISGDIVRGDEAIFRELSVRYPEALVGLDSKGGSIAPALEIGRIIRLMGYRTAVTDNATCVSACALIWLAGTPRLLQPGGRIGFHASYKDEGGKLVETGVGNAVVGHYLSHLNLSRRAVIFATSASPYEVSWLTPANKISSGIDFGEVTAEKGPRRAPGPVYIPPAPVYVPPPAVSFPSPARSAKTDTRPPATPSAATPSPLTPSALTTSKLKREDLERAIRALVTKPSFGDKVAAKFDVSVSQQRIIADHVRRIYGNDQLLTRFATEMAAVGGALTGPQAEQIGYEVGVGVAEKLVYPGLTRLPDADLRRFLAQMAMIPRDTSPAECGEMFWPKTGGSATLEFEVVGRQGDEALTTYLAIMRRAIFAESAQSPGPVKLTATQYEAAESAFAQALEENLTGRTEAEKAKFFATFDDMDAADTASQCDAMRVLLTTAAQMPGLTGDWFRRSFIASMAE